MTDLDAKLARIKLLSVDVDGVQTDGGLYYAEDGTELRKFNVLDGFGLKMVQQAGLPVALITASKTPAIAKRGARLGLAHVHVGVGDKVAVLEDICAKMDIGLMDVAHIGDDLNDVPVLKRVGCPLSVANGRDAVKSVALWSTKAKGGDGAVRELCERILRARGIDPSDPDWAADFFADGAKVIT